MLAWFSAKYAIEKGGEWGEKKTADTIHSEMQAGFDHYLSLSAVLSLYPSG